jgi:hypothetical protein
MNAPLADQAGRYIPQLRERASCTVQCPLFMGQIVLIENSDGSLSWFFPALKLSEGGFESSPEISSRRRIHVLFCGVGHCLSPLVPFKKNGPDLEIQ